MTWCTCFIVSIISNWSLVRRNLKKGAWALPNSSNSRWKLAIRAGNRANVRMIYSLWPFSERSATRRPSLTTSYSACSREIKLASKKRSRSKKWKSNNSQCDLSKATAQFPSKACMKTVTPTKNRPKSKSFCFRSWLRTPKSTPPSPGQPLL